MNNDLWPALPLAEWQDTYATLHMWTQIVGKIRLAQTPLVNHWWNVPLYVTDRGLTTSPIPYKDRTFESISRCICRAIASPLTRFSGVSANPSENAFCCPLIRSLILSRLWYASSEGVPFVFLPVGVWV